MNKLTCVFAALFVSLASFNSQGEILNQPEGWATCTSIRTAGDYNLTGGGNGSLIVLRNDFTDMGEKIRQAVNSHDIILFDGKDGAFLLNSNIHFQSLKNKTLVGVNGACFRTTFTVSQEIHHLLDSLNVKSLSSWAEDNLGGTLSNGIYVKEQCERAVRQALIDYYNDPKETYRNSGIFVFNGCSNIIIRNLDFVGPGCIDLGAADLVTLNGCDHVWVDHCRFTDGMDGNMDIVCNSDFVTVSNCHFRYTERAYNHPLSNLSGGVAVTDGSDQQNNISWMRCFWDEGCGGRMPWTQFGIHHILNCYWDCKGGTSIDAHELSKVLIEGCYFSERVGKPLAVRDDNVLYEWRGSIVSGKPTPVGNAVVTVPYDYCVYDAMEVPEKAENVGPTLKDPYTKQLSASPECINLGNIYSGNRVNGMFNISAYGVGVPEFVTLKAPEGVLLSTSSDGEYTSTLTISAADADFFQADVYFKATISKSGDIEETIELSAPGLSLAIPLKAHAIALEGKGIDVSVSWALDSADSSATYAKTEHPELFSRIAYETGEKLFVQAAKKIGDDGVFTHFNPTEDIGKVRDEECCVNFDIATEPGYIFVPKTLRLKASRVATDMCNIDIEVSRHPSGSAEPLTLLKGFQPARNSNSPACSEIEIPLANAGTGQDLRVAIYLYNMLASKQLALSDLMVEGTLYQSSSSVADILPDIANPAENASDTSDTSIYYDLQGRRVPTPRRGLFIQSSHSSLSSRLILIP